MQQQTEKNKKKYKHFKRKAASNKQKNTKQTRTQENDVFIKKPLFIVVIDQKRAKKTKAYPLAQ